MKNVLVTLGDVAELHASEEALQSLVVRVADALAASCALVLTEGPGAPLERVAVHPPDQPDVASQRPTPAEAYGDSACLRTARTGQAVRVVEVTAAQRAFLAPELPAFGAQGALVSLMTVPLLGKGQVRGVLSLGRYGQGARAFSAADETSASQLSSVAALLLEALDEGRAFRRELEEKQRASVEAQRFTALVQASTDFIGMATLEGQTLFVNRAGRALVGLDPDLDITQVPLRLFHTDAGMKRAEALLAHGHWEGEGQLRHQGTGELIGVQLSSFLVRDNAGKPLGFGTVQRDMRERQKLEAQLRQLQKMEAVSRLAGGVAHDFNNLLTIILSYSASLADDKDMAPSARADVTEIHAAAQRAAALTRRLLTFSRQQVFQPREVDLNAVVLGIDPMLRRLLREDVVLEIEPSPGG